jgi:hypothetical protein
MGLAGFLLSLFSSGSIAATKKYWLFYAPPETYLSQRGIVDLPQHAFWSCEPDTKRGDLILVYRRSMSHLKVDDLVREFGMARDVATNVKQARIGMDFPVIWEASSNARATPQWHWPYGCDTKEIRRIDPPLLLKALKSESKLREWEGLRLNLQARGRSALEIPEFAWNVIMSMIQTRKS